MESNQQVLVEGLHLGVSGFTLSVRANGLPPQNGEMAFVSCISPTLFQPVGSGSHLYSAHTNTVRSGHRVEGLTDSRGSFPLGLPCPRLLCLDYITLLVICQALFLLFFGGNGWARPSKLRVSAESNRLVALPKPLTMPTPLNFVP